MDAVDCVVVGAGPAGLAASRALSDRGIEHVVLERGRVGETWRSHLPRGVTDDAGVPRHVDGAAELPGLWFVGLRWMTRRGSSNLYGMPDDAARVADGVAARLDGSVGSTPRGSLP